MIPSSIISTVTNAIFGKRTNSHTHTKRAYIRVKREDKHTFPVVYENHDPIVECFDMSSEEHAISDKELKRYADLQDDINIHDLPSNQSLILHDALYIDCQQNNMRLERAHSKGLVYNMNTTSARTLNAQKFNNRYKHKNRHTHHLHTNIRDDIAFVAHSMLQSPVNMLDISTGTLRHITVDTFEYKQAIADICNLFRNVSFVFNINGYKVTVHNVDAVGVDVQRVLHNRQVCDMCVLVNFNNERDHHGRIEYTHNNGTHYTHNIEHDVRGYYYPSIPVHEGTLRIASDTCGIQPSVPHSVAHAQNDRNVVLYTILGAIGLVSVISAALYKPLRTCIRRFMSITPLRIEDNNDEDMTMIIEYETVV